MSNSLGRGLSSLIPQKVKKIAAASDGEAVIDVVNESDKDKILNVSPNKISRNPMQPRKNFDESQLNELAGSLKQYGVIQPLIVTRKNSGYELIAGERRLRAAKILGLETVPIIVRQTDEQERLELALVENLQREDLNPIEAAMAYRKLIDEFNLSQEELSARLGKSRPVIANTLRLLNLPPEIQDALIERRLNITSARIIAGLEGEDRQLALFRKIMRDNMTSDQAIHATRVMGGTKEARIKINYADKDKEFALRQFFGTKAEIKRKGRGGEIIIHFYSDEELEEMINKIKK